MALLFAEAEDPGAGGEVGVDAIERAAVVVDFALNCWRALPEQGSLGLSWRHKVLDEGVEKLRVWVEGRGGEATRRELQRAHVAGVRAASDLDALLERYEDTYPNCVVEVVPEHGGLPTRVVRAPARRPVLAPVSPLATVGEAVAARPRPDGLDATVAAATMALATALVATLPDRSVPTSRPVAMASSCSVRSCSPKPTGS